MRTPPTGAAVTIRALLDERHVSQALLGSKLGLPQSAVSDRLRGRTAFREPELRTVALFLDVPLSRLLEEPAPVEVAS